MFCVLAILLLQGLLQVGYDVLVEVAYIIGCKSLQEVGAQFIVVQAVVPLLGAGKPTGVVLMKSITSSSVCCHRPATRVVVTSLRSSAHVQKRSNNCCRWAVGILAG